jgi:hypothetical protein
MQKKSKQSKKTSNILDLEEKLCKKKVDFWFELTANGQKARAWEVSLGMTDFEYNCCLEEIDIRYDARFPKKTK